MLGLI